MNDIFRYIKYFTKDENWGDYSKLNGMLLLTLDKIRDIYNHPFVIHNAYSTTGHTPRSQHYIGNAVDFHIVSGESFREQIDKLLYVFDILQISERIGFGIYPNWAHPGFHFDIRGTHARWGRLGDTYVAFETAYNYVSNNRI